MLLYLSRNPSGISVLFGVASGQSTLSACRIRSNGNVIVVVSMQDILVNTRSIEQWSFSTGSVFVADHSGEYAATMQGQSASRKLSFIEAHCFSLRKMENGELQFVLKKFDKHISLVFTGEIVHMWRYDESSKRLHISRSFLFTDKQVRSTTRLFEPTFSTRVSCPGG